MLKFFRRRTNNFDLLMLAINDYLVDMHMVGPHRLHIEVGKGIIVCLAWGDSDEIEEVLIDKLDLLTPPSVSFLHGFLIHF